MCKKLAHVIYPLSSTMILLLTICTFLPYLLSASDQTLLVRLPDPLDNTKDIVPNKSCDFCIFLLSQYEYFYFKKAWK